MKQDVRLSFVVKEKDGRLIVGPLDPDKLPINAVKCDDGYIVIMPVPLHEDGSMDENIAYPATLIINPFAYVEPDKSWDEMIAAKAVEPRLTRTWNHAVLGTAKRSIDQAVARNDKTDGEIEEATRQSIVLLQLDAEVKKAAITLTSSDVS